MSKNNNIKHRLRTDPDSMFFWTDGGYLPTGMYESAEITGVQISLMLEGYDDVYVITVLPGDEYGSYDAWLRRMGSTDMIHILSKRARDPEDVVVAAKECLPDYIGIV